MHTDTFYFVQNTAFSNVTTPTPNTHVCTQRTTHLIYRRISIFIGVCGSEPAGKKEGLGVEGLTNHF